MSTRYVMQEMNDLNNEGKTLLYPRMVMREPCDLDELARMVSDGSTYGTGEIKGVIEQVTHWMAMMMAMGRSVKIPGLGTFTPLLALKKGKERENPDGSGTKRNAASIRVGSIGFRVDKELVDETDRHCTLERSPEKATRTLSKYTPEERLALAKRYLEKHPSMTLDVYAALTDVSKSTASRELRRWREMPESGIGVSGWGTHKVYVLRKPVSGEEG